MTTPTPKVNEEVCKKWDAFFHSGETINEEKVLKFLAQLLSERDTLWQERVDELNSQIIRLKSDIAHAIGFCRGVGHPENYLEKYYPTLIPDQKEKEDA